MRKKTMSLIAGVALVLAACGVDGVGASIEGAWELESGTYDGQEIELIPTHPITLTLEDGQASGTAACNSYGGDFTLEGEEIRFPSFSFTEMACMPPETMELEQAYLTALLNVETATIEDGDLVLTGSRTELVFIELEPVPTSDLQNTLWELDSLIQGDAVSSVAGDPATLELFEDGTLSGSTGCRILSGEFQVTGAEVLFTSFAADGDCQPDLQSQDNHVITVLGDGFRVDIAGDTLTLTSQGGEGLVYKASS